MHFFQLAAAWLFPCAVCATLATTATAMATATDGASTIDSSPFPALSACGVKEDADPGSSPSASSTTSSSTSSLLGTRCGSPEKQEGGGAATPKGDAVRRCLRRLARKLQRATGADDVRPDGRRGRKKSRSTKPDRLCGGVVDGTNREREEAVASAIAYCKETKSRRCKCPALRRDVSLLEWLPEAPACTLSAADPHHRGCAACDGCDGKSAAETGKRASRCGRAGELGMDDVFDGLDIDVLRITNYFAAKFVQRDDEQLLN